MQNHRRFSSLSLLFSFLIPYLSPLSTGSLSKAFPVNDLIFQRVQEQTLSSAVIFVNHTFAPQAELSRARRIPALAGSDDKSAGIDAITHLRPKRVRFVDVSSYLRVGRSNNGTQVNPFQSVDPVQQFLWASTHQIGIGLLRKGYFGIAANVQDDPVELDRRKQLADLFAQQIQGQTAAHLGVELLHLAFETKGEVDGGHDVLARSGAMGARTVVGVYSDVVENTSAFAKGKPGSSSIISLGDAAIALGAFSDEARAMMIVTVIDQRYESAVLAKYGVNSIEDLLDPLNDADLNVLRIAQLNGVTPNQVDVVVLPNKVQHPISGQFVAREALQLNRLKSSFPGFTYAVISEGTVLPAKMASLGYQNGRVQVFLGRSGLTEAAEQLAQSSIFDSEGSLAVMRPVSSHIKTNFSRHNKWEEVVRQKMENARRLSGKNDAERIFSGHISYSSRQLARQSRSTGGVFTSLTGIPKAGFWPYAMPSVHEARNSVFEVHTLHFQKTPDSAHGQVFLSIAEYDFNDRLTTAAGSGRYTPVILGAHVGRQIRAGT